MNANLHQVGGTHYKGDKVEPWDYISQHNLDFFLGNAVKYITRYNVNGNTNDIRKAIHYLEKKLELVEVSKQNDYSCGGP